MLLAAGDAVDLPAAPDRDLRAERGGRAEAVDGEALGRRRFRRSSGRGSRGDAAGQPGVVTDDPDQPQAAVADDAGAEQRSCRHRRHAGRETVDEPGRRQRVLGEAAVHVPAGEERVLAEVLLPAPAEAAGLVGLVQPRHADAVAHGERRRSRLAARRDELRTGTERHDLADDLMAGNDGRAVRRQLALEDVQVGAADAAGQHPQEDLAADPARAPEARRAGAAPPPQERAPPAASRASSRGSAVTSSTSRSIGRHHDSAQPYDSTSLRRKTRYAANVSTPLHRANTPSPLRIGRQ